MTASIDWKVLEGDYRAGIKSLRALAAEYGISESAIRKHVKRDGWERDLGDKIRQRATSIVLMDAVRSDKVRTPDGIFEHDTIESNAQVQAYVIRDHRSLLRRCRALADRLLGELEAITYNRELFERLGELLMDSAEDGPQDKRLEALAKVLSLSGRIDSFKKLAEAQRIVVTLERDVFGISADTAPKPYEDLSPDQIKARILHLQAKATGIVAGANQ
jgi:hypothetical protein